ncbi:MAG: hypothetical protein DHS20C10_08100 [marine bacterium B5-7]|nr:MAG: hypothetical protein DHS20C10_08100 [marine bacterium B5-7]
MPISKEDYLSVVSDCILDCEYDTHSAQERLHRLISTLLHPETQPQALQVVIRQTFKGSDKAAYIDKLKAFVALVQKEEQLAENKKTLQAYHQDLIKDIQAEHDRLIHLPNPVYTRWVDSFVGTAEEHFPEYKHRHAELPIVETMARDAGSRCICFTISDVDIVMPEGVIHYLDKGWRPPEAVIRLVLGGGVVTCSFQQHHGAAGYRSYQVADSVFQSILANGSQDRLFHDERYISCGFLAKVTNKETGAVIVVDTYDDSTPSVGSGHGAIAAFYDEGMTRLYPLEIVRKRLRMIAPACLKRQSLELEPIELPHFQLPPRFSDTCADLPKRPERSDFPGENKTERYERFKAASVAWGRIYYPERTRRLRELGSLMVDKLGAVRADFSNQLTSLRLCGSSGKLKLVIPMNADEWAANQPQLLDLSRQKDLNILMSQLDIFEQCRSNTSTYRDIEIAKKIYRGELVMMGCFGDLHLKRLEEQGEKFNFLRNLAMKMGCDPIELDEGGYFRDHWDIEFSSRENLEKALEILAQLGFNPFGVVVRGMHILLQHMVYSEQLEPLSSIEIAQVKKSARILGWKDYFLSLSPENLHERLEAVVSSNGATFSMKKLSELDERETLVRDLVNSRLKTLMNTLALLLKKTGVEIIDEETLDGMSIAIASDDLPKAMNKLNALGFLRSLMSEMLMAMDMIMLGGRRLQQSSISDAKVLALYQAPGELQLSTKEGRAQHQVSQSFDAVCLEYLRNGQIESITGMINDEHYGYIPSYDIMLKIFEIESKKQCGFHGTILALQAIDAEKYAGGVKFLQYLNRKELLDAEYEIIHFHLKAYEFNLHEVLDKLTCHQGLTVFWQGEYYFALYEPALGVLMYLLDSRETSFSALVTQLNKQVNSFFLCSDQRDHFLFDGECPQPGKMLSTLMEADFLTCQDKKHLVSGLFDCFIQKTVYHFDIYQYVKKTGITEEQQLVIKAINAFVENNYLSDVSECALANEITLFNSDVCFKKSKVLDTRREAWDSFLIEIDFERMYNKLRQDILKTCKKVQVSSSDVTMFWGRNSGKEKKGEQPKSSNASCSHEMLSHHS